MRGALAAACMVAACAAGNAMADWKLLHVDDFRSGARLDPAFWATETGLQRNREAQYYTAANVAAGEGFLRIEARREEVPNAAFRAGARDWRHAARTAAYTSGSIVSRASFRYGRFEVVARSPGGAGVWPAIWLAHESATQYGEIDIYEFVGKHPDTVFAGVHYGRTPNTREHRSGNVVVPALEGTWRVHALEWTPHRIHVTVDGRTVLEFDPARAAGEGTDPLRQPMRLRINLALGGNWGRAIDDARLPARFDIASVRIWSWAPGAGEVVQPAAEVLQQERAVTTPRWGR